MTFSYVSQQRLYSSIFHTFVHDPPQMSVCKQLIRSKLMFSQYPFHLALRLFFPAKLSVSKLFSILVYFKLLFLCQYHIVQIIIALN